MAVLVRMTVAGMDEVIELHGVVQP
jgi:hypothetical protein